VAPRDPDPCWQILGLEPGSSEAQLRRAYARKLKELDQATQRSEFQELRDAFDHLLQVLAGHEAQRQEAAAPPWRPNADELAIRDAVNAYIVQLSAGQVDEAVAAMRALAQGPLCEVFTGRWQAIQGTLSAFDGGKALPGRFCLEFLEAFGIDESVAQSLGRPPVLERFFELRDVKIWVQDSAAAWKKKFGTFQTAKLKPSQEEVVLNFLRWRSRPYVAPLSALYHCKDRGFSSTMGAILDWIDGLVVDPDCLGLQRGSMNWWRRRLQFQAWPLRRDWARLSSLPLTLAAFLVFLSATIAFDHLADRHQWLMSDAGLGAFIGGCILSAVFGLATFMSVFNEWVGPLFRHLRSLTVPAWLDLAVAAATILPPLLLSVGPSSFVLLILVMGLYCLYRLWDSDWGPGWGLIALLVLAGVKVWAEGRYDDKGWVDALALGLMWAVYFVIERWTAGRAPKPVEAPKASLESSSYRYISWIVAANMLRLLSRENWELKDWALIFAVIVVIILGEKFNWADAIKGCFKKRPSGD
jgi:hypothetical protein